MFPRRHISPQVSNSYLEQSVGRKADVAEEIDFYELDWNSILIWQSKEIQGKNTLQREFHVFKAGND